MFIEAGRLPCRTPAGCYVGHSILVGELTCARRTPLGATCQPQHTSLYDERLQRQRPGRELEFDSNTYVERCRFLVSKLRGNQILNRKSARSEERDLLVRFATRDLTRYHVG
jgi:hypothetical protein